jgi:nitrite reductase (NO-forming)
MVVAGGLLIVVSLGLLGAILLGAIRRSLLKRSDLSSRFYLLAIGAGVIGVTLGGLLGSGVATGSYEEMRAVHIHLNLVGLVGLTIVGTLPTILPTLAHRRAVSGQEARIAWWLAIASVVVMTSGLVIGQPGVGSGALLAGASLAMILVGVAGRLGKSGLEAGLPYLQVCLGCGWLLLWVVIDGLALIQGDGLSRFSGWNAAVIVAGVGQVLLGSLAYLLPVLAGGRTHLAHNLERAGNRPWLPLVAANMAGVGLAAGLGLLAGAGLVAWLADFGFRLTRFEWRDSDQIGSMPSRAS